MEVGKVQELQTLGNLIPLVPFLSCWEMKNNQGWQQQGQFCPFKRA